MKFYHRQNYRKKCGKDDCLGARQGLPGKSMKALSGGLDMFWCLDRDLGYTGGCICQSSKRTHLGFAHFILIYSKGKKIRRAANKYWTVAYVFWAGVLGGNELMSATHFEMHKNIRWIEGWMDELIVIY